MASLSFRVLILAIGLACASIAYGDADTPGNRFSQAQKLLPSAALLCSGHVTGASKVPGQPGPHISWHAYALHESPEMTTIQFTTALLAKPGTSPDGCNTWRSETGPVQTVIDVCASSTRGPWSACAAPPVETQTIVVKSEMVGQK